MTMGKMVEISDVTPDEEFYECPSCGYSDGFHVALKMMSNGRQGEIILICPECHKRFRIGWPMTMDR